MLVFDPNILAHSALVTTDMGVTLFFLASIYAFYRYVNAAHGCCGWLLAGVVGGTAAGHQAFGHPAGPDARCC